jgi:GAF domain-containing protein
MTGATGVHLLLWSDNEQDWCVPTPGGEASMLPLSGVDREHAAPMSVLGCVQRMREPLVTADATRDERFASDPYFSDADCCSLLALPIVNSGALSGILLLENRLMRNAFTGERLEAVKLIAGQLAVCLDNAQLHAEFGRIADEQLALRRVATLVARGVESAEVFAAVTDEMRRCLHVITAGLWRYETSGEITLLGAAAPPELIAKWPLGARTPIEGDNIASVVLSTGRPARMDDYETAAGPVAARVRALGVRAAVGVPVVVDGRVWGLTAVGSVSPGPMPDDTEARIADFADLVATAIATATARADLHESRDQLLVLAEQQAALRRVATLVARGASPSEVFSAVADELARVLHVVNAGLLRYEPDGSGYVVGVQYEPGITSMPVTGERIPLAGDDVGAQVLHTGRAARIDNHETVGGPEAERVRAAGIGSIVGVPVVVNGRVWGAAIVGSGGPGPMPADTESRIADFADLVATAIANADTRFQLQASRDELRVLAEQQAALRRVATLVARGANPSEVFATVADEMARCLQVDHAALFRYDTDDVLTPLALYHRGLETLPKGIRLRLDAEPLAAEVLSTGAATRLDISEDTPAPHGGRIRGLGIHSAAAVPIIVDEHIWGVAIAGSLEPEPLPLNTEARLHDFADLIATAIANAATRAELVASRARIVTTGDEVRRRLERNLHDGVQQRLVSLGLAVRMAEDAVPPGEASLKAQLSRITAGLTDVSDDLREIARGIHPAILSKGGLGPALKTLARRSSVPVTLDVTITRRLPAPIEVAAYYVVAEALTNAAKHAQASEVTVCVDTQDGDLRLLIRDNGIGGADTTKGSGLVGLKDRVEAVGGRLQLSSPLAAGTSLSISIPLESG